MTTQEEKQKENKIIKHILQTNNYTTLFDIKHKKQQSQEDNPNRTTTKWAKFTYTGREIRIITKLSRHTNVRISYTTNNNLIFDVIIRHTQPLDVTHNTTNRTAAKT
jgi:hypothetical protein